MKNWVYSVNELKNFKKKVARSGLCQFTEVAQILYDGHQVVIGAWLPRRL